MKQAIKTYLIKLSNWFNLNNIEENTNKFLNLIIKLFSILAFIVIVIITISTINDESYIIKPFHVTKFSEESGVSGLVVANSINDKINEIIEGYYESNDNEYDTSKTKQKIIKIPSDNNLQKEKVVLDEFTLIQKRRALQMEIEGIGVNFNSFIESLQHLIGKQQNYVSGDIAIIDSSLNLNLRLTGHRPIVLNKPFQKTNFKKAYNSIIQESAEYILENLNPANLLYYYYKNERDKDAKRIAYKILISSDIDIKHSYNILGQLANKQGDKKLALIMYNESLKHDSNFSSVYNNIAICQSEIKDFENAVLNYKKAIKLENENPSYHKNLSICFAKQNKLKEAIEEAKYAVSINKYNTSYLRNLATIYRKDSMYDDAIKIYEECLRIDINSAKTYNNIAVVYQKKMDLKNSYSYANKSLSIDSTFSLAYSTIAENYAIEKDSIKFKKNLTLALKYKYPLQRLNVNKIHMDYIYEIGYDSIINLLNNNPINSNKNTN